MDYRNNEVLVAHLRKGEEKAFIFLLDTYHRRLNAYALSLIGDGAMAQDIVQNVFLRTWQFRKKLKSEYPISSFLYKSVYNEFVNKYQKDKSMMLLQKKYLESLEAVVEATDESALNRMIAIVNQEIQNLPPKCKRVFMLSKKEGLTNVEISEHLNVSIKTVEAQITKAFLILRRKLGDKYEMILMFLLHGRKIAMTGNG
ncbi:sigma-70 family RNA polymerase sigma factor [Flavobacteriaceae bacterium TP-CH-4]|uniref:Sigma-70 family RNA polymerase sigma factor n=1 Tax=Pelagihabitans pacificus TaxID=2696054 RepID=A0A967AQP3_9FLAO|nr:sigma-70 family RNA polymerase sigma factor [Pelagihabitans pacificus]NHF58604.1 sigma-70 family RNA polymerase sigma factor [Pelagihabitans pacificus]